MQRYLLSRLLQAVAILFGVLLLVFLMVRATGDPAALMMPREASQQDIQAFRHAMGFDRPLLIQFWDFLSGVVVGDFGNSLYYKTPALPLDPGTVAGYPATSLRGDAYGPGSWHPPGPGRGIYAGQPVGLNRACRGITGAEHTQFLAGNGDDHHLCR